MSNLSDEQKNNLVQIILQTIDDVNVVLQTPNYQRKYSEDKDMSHVTHDDESVKRFFVTSREQLRKILITDWYQTKFTESQITEITNTLSLTRQKISDLFTN